MNVIPSRGGKNTSFGCMAAALMLCGCAAVGPDFEKPEAPTPEGWLETAESKLSTDASDHREWWKSFGDPALEALIQRAYEENQALEIAGLRVYEARANLAFAVGTLYPQVTQARLSADGIQLSENSEPIAYLPPLVQQGVDTDFSTYRLGFDAAWELDFWGRFRRIVEAADSSLAARVAAYAGGDEVNPLVEEYESWLNENYPQIMTRVRKYTVGPGDTWPFELRKSGPAEADLDTLRRLGEEAMGILRVSPYAKQVRTDMRQRVQKVVVDYDQDRARWAAVSRSDVDQATSRATDGTLVGLYREGDSLLPIIARDAEPDRQRVAGQLHLGQVQPSFALDSAPLGQVTDDIRLEWEDPIITRWNRRRQQGQTEEQRLWRRSLSTEGRPLSSPYWCCISAN
jgi:hypothetical protein